MRTVNLMRNPSTDDGTFGVLLMDDHTSFSTGELPWKNNDHGTSCIPTGTYVCTWFNSPKHGWGYLIKDVPSRSMCEIHSANFMGDISKGKVSQLLGCIALGKSIGPLGTTPGVSQMAVLASKVAIAEFDAKMNKEDFTLVIHQVGV